MAIIALEGMRFYAYHGVYEAEKILGNEYLVDVYIETAAVAAAGASDKLEQTVNYETVYQICRLEMNKPRQLLEAVLAGIMTRLKQHFGNMISARVRVGKLNPPVGGRARIAWVEDVQQLLTPCPRCQKPFANYQSDCWERVPNVHPATRETLQRQYGGKCLCENCLKLFAG